MLLSFYRSIKKNHRWDYFLFALLGLFVFTWFEEGSFIAAPVFRWRVDFPQYLQELAYTWNRMWLLGYSTTRSVAFLFPHAISGAFLQLLFHLKDSLLYEKTLFYVCFAGSGISAYFLLKTLKLRRVACLLGGLLYMFNTFGTVVVWYLATGFLFPFYAFFPLLVALYIKVLQGEVSLALAILVGGVVPAVSAYSNPAFFVLLVGVLVVYTLFIGLDALLSRNYLKLRKVVFRGAGFGTLLLLASSFWILPFLGDLTTQYELASNEAMGLVGDLASLQQNSVGFLDALRLQGLWSFYGSGNEGDLYYLWSGVFRHWIFTVFSLLLPVVVGLGTWSILKSRQVVKLVWPALLLVCVVLVSGFKSPLAPLLERFYATFPFLARMFRAGYTKYGLVLVLGVVVLFAFGVQSLRRFRWNRCLLLLVIPIFVLGFPLLTGDVIYQGGDYAKPFYMQVPEAYSQFKDWDEQSVGGLGRYLSLPLAETYNWVFNWERGYHGSDLLPDFSTQGVIGHAGHPLIKVLGEEINRGDISAVNRLSGLLSIQKFILREDAGWQTPSIFLTRDRSRVLSFLDNYSLEKDLGLLKVYPAEEDFFLPKFFVPEYEAFLQGGVELLPEILSLDEVPVRVGIHRQAQGKLDEWVVEVEEAEVLSEDNLAVDQVWEKADLLLWSLPLVGWEGGTDYQISFDYQLGRNVGLYVAVFEHGYSEMRKEGGKWVYDRHPEIREVWYEEVKGSKGNRFISTFTSNLDSTAGEIYVGILNYNLSPAAPEGKINSVEVKKILEPEVLLTKKQGSKEARKQVPQITFVRVNPTKYRVKVAGAIDPYTLVFNESFHPGWRIYLGDGEDKGDRGDVYGKETAFYFDGEVKEGTHRSTFIDSSTLETFNLSPLQADHLMVNGYANSWYIEPSDVDLQENYELIIEFEPQRFFYIGLFVSVLTLGGCLFYLGYSKLKRY